MEFEVTYAINLLSAMSWRFTILTFVKFKLFQLKMIVKHIYTRQQTRLNNFTRFTLNDVISLFVYNLFYKHYLIL